MPIIQVTGNPTNWTSGSGVGTTAGSNGYNAFSVWLDKDGTTAWMFEAFGSGFKRFNLSDGSTVHDDAMFGVPGGGSGEWYNREDGTSFWQQDGAGNYYAIPYIGFANHTLYKFAIGSGSAGNLLNGYCTTPTTLDLTALTPAPPSYGFEDMLVFASGGVNYIALISAFPKTLYIINADTLAFVGSYTCPDSLHGWKVFVDINSDLWAMFGLSAPSSNCDLVKWHPADGATGTALNFTTAGAGLHTVTAATMGISLGIQFATYVPATNSVWLGNGQTGDTGDCCNIDLTTFARNALHLDDHTFLYTSTYDALESACNNGVVGGVLCIPGDLSPDTTQLGGIANLVDPTALTLTSTLNITAAINSQGGLTAVPMSGSQLNPFGNMQWDGVKLLVTYEYNGSPVYIVPLAAPVTAVDVEPDNASITTAMMQQFTANLPVTWSCSRGSITSGGLFTPAVDGTFTVTGTSIADPTKSDTVSIVVKAHYRAVDGLMISAVEFKDDGSPNNCAVTGFLSDTGINEHDIDAQLFDNATFELRVVNWSDLTQGPIKMLSGTVGDIVLDHVGGWSTELRGLTQKLTTQIGKVYGPTCLAELFGGGAEGIDPSNHFKCRLNRADWVQNGTVQSSYDSLTIVPFSEPSVAEGLEMVGSATPDAPAPAGWFNDGLITFTSGPLDGYSFEIATWDGTTLVLFGGAPMPFPPNSGDTFEIEPGCDKLKTTCFAKFSNIINFAGFAEIPGLNVIQQSSRTQVSNK